MIINLIKFYFHNLKKDLILSKLKIKWRTLNKHNFTGIGNLIDLNKIKIGMNSYGLINALHSYGSKNEYLSVGNYCSISTNVYFILGGEHNYKHLSTFPFNSFFLSIKNDSFSKGPIILEDDVWIGHGAIILSGVTLSKGTVVAAGSVVTKSTKPYSIVGGNPAKLIKYRFNKDLIRELNEIDFSKINKNNYSLLSDLLNSPIELASIKKLLNLL
jgi:acetyltransferase-like isoleucine patch superfamily enzyme